jgi:hypothetical protein
MFRGLRLRFWIETALAALGFLLLALTLVMPDWIEFFFGINPDAGSGAAEWAIGLFLLLISVTSSFLARAEWKAHALSVK